MKQQAFDVLTSVCSPPRRARSLLDNQTILVTGGAGFVGSHLVEKLLSHGHDVISFDNYSTGNRRNLASLLSNPRFTAHQHDISEPAFLHVDKVFNLACPASPVHYQADPLQTTRTIVLGAINVLELGRTLDVPVLQASTSEVYGDPEVHPQSETYPGHVNMTGPRACYDEGKRCAESLFFDYRRQHGLTIKVARIFNTYGPNMSPNDGRVVSNLIMQALRNQPLSIYGDGSQTRSFCYVDDLVEGLVGLMASDRSVTGPINLGNPVETSVGELAELVIELTGSRSRIARLPLPVDDPRRRRPDITVARETLGWTPKIDLTEGLQRTIAYFDALLREADQPAAEPVALAG